MVGDLVGAAQLCSYLVPSDCAIVCKQEYMMKLGRFLFDPQYRALLKWQSANGDETLRYDYDLNPHDIVFDIGAFKGEFAAKIARKYGCVVHAFEPIEQFAEEATASVQGLNNVYVHKFGLSSARSLSEISLEGLASSRNKVGRNNLIAKFENIAEIMPKLAPRGVALMKINIEGDEYLLVDHMINCNLIHQIDQLQIQFHIFKFSDRFRYNAVRTKMQKTHLLVWRFPYIWESWKRKLRY